ncbi:MAG: HAMP domain-containing histidine kinase [Gammaproteobacteria bacterium]|nr:HAMP domain-containing histidine kinase [Gammaproteobacteria bacterium]
MSLRRFILVQFLLIAGILSLINGGAIHGLYHWGLDDASEFYLWRDAEQAMARYESEGRLPEGDAFLRFYPRLAALPDGYRQAIAAQGWKREQMGMLGLPGETVYFLAFPLAGAAEPAWVLHRFREADDEGYTGLSLGELSLLLLAGSLPPLALIAHLLFRSLVRPLARLSRWAETLPGQAEPLAPPAEELRFGELQGLAARLHGAFTEIARQNTHEQRFLQTLSHELRTPLAVVSAAVEVLNRREAGAEQRAPLARIGRAVQAMASLTTSLLWLWREGGREPEVQVLALGDSLQALWEELSASGLCAGFSLDNRVPAEARVLIAPPLLRIALGNALRNALNYGRPGAIQADWAEGELRIVNALPETDAAPEPEPGFGLGLYLIRRIAERQGWSFATDANEGCFILSLGLRSAQVTLPLPGER